MKNFGRTIKCTAAAAVCMFAFSGCENYSKMMKDEPQEYLNLATENTMKAVADSTFSKEFDVLEKAIADGTFTYDASFEGTNVSGEIYVNEKDEKTSQLHTIKAGDKKVDIYAAVDGGKVKFGTIGESGEHIYEIDLKNLEKDFSDSIFAPDSGSSAALAQEDYDIIIKSIGEINTALNGDEDELPESYKELQKKIEKFLKDNAPEVEEKADAEIDGTEVKANILTYNFDKEDVKELVDAYMVVILEEMREQGSFDDFYTEEDFKAEYEEMYTKIEKLDIEAVYYVNSKTHNLMQVECNVDATVEGEAMTADVVSVFGAEPDKSQEKTVEVNVVYAGQEVAVIITTEVKDENNTVVDIELKTMGMSMEVVTLDFEKDGEDYTITAKVPVISAEATVEGTVKGDKKSVEFTVDKVKYNAEGVDGEVALDIRFAAEQGGKFDDRKAEKNFFDITEDELDKFAEDVENDFTAVGDNMETGNDPITGSMFDYIDKSQISSANANAKMVYTAFASVLTQMAIEGVECTEYSFSNTASGDLNIKCGDYDMELADYLGDSFEGYFHVSVDPSTYAVEYALWSEEPLEYTFQPSETDQEYMAEEGSLIGCYPYATY